MKKYWASACLAMSIFALAACNDDTSTTDPAKDVQQEEQTTKTTQNEKKLSTNGQVTPVSTIETFIASYYFNEGTYADYTSLFVDPSLAKPEKEFNANRQNNSQKITFGDVTVTSLSEAKKHLQLREIDENTAEVHFVKDQKDEKLNSTQFYWLLEKVEDKWRIK